MFFKKLSAVLLGAFVLCLQKNYLKRMEDFNIVYGTIPSKREVFKMDLGNSKLHDLIIEEEKLKGELKTANQDLRIIQSTRSSLTRKAITRRLCNHGRLLEHFLPPDKYTDGQMLLILEELFAYQSTKEMMKEFEGIDCDVSHMKSIFY